MTLPPAVRQQIADALESATVEDLHDATGWAVSEARDHSGTTTDAGRAFLRLAGLALAAADRLERTGEI